MFFTFRNGRINFSDTGKGIPIVLLHGYLETSEIWKNFEMKLASEFRVIAVDLPGCGLSDVYGEVHSMEFMAEAVNEIIDYIGLNKVFLIGHSLGGYVALAFLEQFPVNLSGYCLFHSHPFSDLPATLEKRKREIEIVKMGRKNLMYPENVIRMFALSNLDIFSEDVERSKEIASRITGEGIIALLKGMMIRPSRLSLMEKGIVPCLWILGSKDNYIPSDLILAKVKVPDNLKVFVLKESGHMGFIEEEDLSLSLVTDFIKRIS